MVMGLWFEVGHRELRMMKELGAGDEGAGGADRPFVLLAWKIQTWTQAHLVTAWRMWGKAQ